MTLPSQLVLGCLLSSPAFGASVKISVPSGPGAVSVFTPGIIRALGLQIHALRPALGNPQAISQILLEQAVPAAPPPTRVAAALLLKRTLTEPAAYAAVQQSLTARPNPEARGVASDLAGLMTSIRTEPQARAVFQKTFKPLDDALTSNKPLEEISAAIDAYFTGSFARAGLAPAPRQNAASRFISSLLRDNLFGSAYGNSITRNAWYYDYKLGPRFRKSLLRAGRRDHIMDLGAGEAVFAGEMAGLRPIDASDKQFHSLIRRARKNRPKVSAVSYKIEDPGVKEDGNFRPFKDRYFEDIPVAELLGDFGKVTLATDVWGLFSYTARPSIALRKLHALLADDGELYLLAGVHYTPKFAPSITPASSLYASTVRARDGRTLAFPDWLAELPGFKVEKLKDGTVLRIRKDPKRRLRVPGLRLAAVDDGWMPPARMFVER